MDLKELRSSLEGKREERTVDSRIETRETDEGNIEFEGHAAVFDRLSDDLGGFVEEIARGAFRKVLRSDPDVRFQFNHDPNLVLARSTVLSGVGSLTLREDTRGLEDHAICVPTSAARDLKLLVDAGVVTQQSFSFRVYPGGEDIWEVLDDGTVKRTIISFGALFDVGAVTHPAYSQTDISARAIVHGIEIVSAGGDVREDELRELAWKIHRGEQDASASERHALDLAFEKTHTVSPWLAERALRAASQEPELQAAIPGKRAAVVLEDAPSEEDGEPTQVAFRLLARKRLLDLTTSADEAECLAAASTEGEES